jgi:hypothetical protein
MSYGQEMSDLQPLGAGRAVACAEWGEAAPGPAAHQGRDSDAGG